MLATWLHMMQGTPYIYQGQEIGMTNAYFNSLEDWKDVETHNAYRELVVECAKLSHEEMMKAIQAKGRDNSRTPMQWDDTPNAGFTRDRPWINVNPNYTCINVQAANKDSDSVLNYYKKLIQIRKQYPIVVYGSFTPLLEADDQIFAYMRTFYEESLLVIANFSSLSPTFAW